MPTIQLQLVKPHAGQLQVLREAKRFNTLACGRQFGKTTLALEIVVEAALQGKATAWFNPTYKSNDAAWESLKETLRQLITDANEQARRIQVAGGGSAECWSLIDPDSGRGRQYDLVELQGGDLAGLVDLGTKHPPHACRSPGQNLVPEHAHRNKPLLPRPVPKRPIARQSRMAQLADAH